MGSNKRGHTHDEVSVRAPLADRRVGGSNLGNLLHRLAIPDVDGSTQVAETSDEEQPRLRLVAEEVSWGKTKVMDRVRLGVKENRLSRHVC